MSTQYVNSVFIVHNSKICPPVVNKCGPGKKKKKEEEGENVNGENANAETRGPNALIMSIIYEPYK